MNDSKYDYLVVGSGLFGATFAYKATELGKNCLVIEKRSHLGGNVHCKNIEGINVHEYGPHIFHTSNKIVWDFVNKIVPFRQFTLNTIAYYKGQLYNLPFNMSTFYQLWRVTTPDEAIDKLSEQIVNYSGTPKNLEEYALSQVGKDIFEKLIKGYTEKQWGRPCYKLPSSILKRIPIRLTFNNNYFNDIYQGIPIGGYNKLIDGLLKDTDCILNTDFFNSKYRDWRSYAKNLVYCGPLDQYFDYKYGKLSWRSLRFNIEIKNTPNYQGNAIINFTSSEEPYTRIIEHKHFESFGDEVYRNPKSVISKEYPQEWKDGFEPYYPINDEVNNQLAQLYKDDSKKESDVIFGGRLAEYKYYDMAPVIERALQYFKI